jgi:hypothetical protein
MLRNVGHRQIMETPQEQAKHESLAANGTVDRMVAVMGYVPDMSLRKNLHCVVPPLNS